MTVLVAFVRALRVISLLCITLVLTPYVSAQEKHTLPERQVAVLPYKVLDPTKSNVQVVDCVINNTYHTRFIFDTGSNTPAVASDIVASLHLQTVPKEAPRGVIDGKPANIAPLLLTTPVVGFRMEPVVVNRPDLASLGPNVDGIIGALAFASFGLVFDFQQHTITCIIGGNLSQNEIAALGFSDATILPLTHNNGLYYVQARISNGSHQTTTDLLIDSGSDTTFIHASIANLLGLQATGHDTYRVGIDTHDLPTGHAQASLGLGDIVFPTQAINILSEGQAQIPQVLGLDVLTRFHVLMDLPARKMYLASPLPPTITIKPTAAP